MDVFKIIIIIVIVVFVFSIISWYISTYNKLHSYAIKIDESLSGIDVALAKRYDVLTKTIEVVKGYVKHEQEIMFNVIKLRNNMSIEEMNTANGKMDEDFKKIDLLVENYPDLKASDNFKMLQKTIVDVEEHLQAARRFYNSNVSLYNELLVTFPNNIIAKKYKMVKKDFFSLDGESRKGVKIDL